MIASQAQAPLLSPNVLTQDAAVGRQDRAIFALAHRFTAVIGDVGALLLPAMSSGAMSSQLAGLIDQDLFVVPSFELECGAVLRDAPVAYKTWGTLNERRDNVMIICHAFTGSADVEDWFV
jgi:hypothetical protein